jgi:hypothetical protein
MDGRDKAHYLLKEIIAIEEYAAGFTSEDYSVKEHSQYIQKNASKILEFMFKEMYGNGDEAASNFMLLILIKQLGDQAFPPERLKAFIDDMLPSFKKRLISTIAQMDEIKEGEEWVDDDEEPKPVNPLAN